MMQRTQYASEEARAAVSTLWGLLISSQGIFLLLGVIPSICKDSYLSSENPAILKDSIYHYCSASAANIRYVTPTVIQSMHPTKDIFS